MTKTGDDIPKPLESIGEHTAWDAVRVGVRRGFGFAGAALCAAKFGTDYLRDHAAMPHATARDVVFGSMTLMAYASALCFWSAYKRLKNIPDIDADIAAMEASRASVSAPATTATAPTPAATPNSTPGPKVVEISRFRR